MNNYEFVNYEKTPFDNLQMGIITIAYQGEILLRYKHMSKKDGSGQYFASPSVCITSGTNEKRYMDGLEIDSRKKSEELMSFLRQCVNNANSRTEVSTASPSVFVPVSTITGQTQTQSSYKDQEMPF